MSYDSEILADSPLFYGKHAEASGTTMLDSSGHGRNGTYGSTNALGQAGLLTGESETAVLMQGGNAGAIGWPDDGSLDGLTAMTIESWIKPVSVAGTPMIVSRDGSTERSFQFRLNAGILQFIKIAGGTVTASSSTTLVAGNIYYVAVAYNGTDIRLYINGSLNGTPAAATGTLGTVNRAVDIGARNGGASELFNSVMEKTAIYNTALSPTRIAAHYTAGTTAPPPAGLTGVWGLVA